VSTTYDVPAAITPVIAWAAGWSLSVFIAVGPVVHLSGVQNFWFLYPLAPLIGSIAFGFPAYVGARSSKSSRPRWQALIWVIGFTATVVILAQFAAASTKLASLGELNINTTETMRQREASFRRRSSSGGRVPRDADAVGARDVRDGCGFLSALAAQEAGFGSVLRALLFGIASCLALFMGLILLLVVGPYLAHFLSFAPVPAWDRVGAVLNVALVGFVSGSVFGSIVELARSLLLHPPR
jgi:hypothetical protein